MDARGPNGIAEAIYLRDHITRQLELAAVAADPAERQARCTFIVVGAGYTGTEVAAQGQLLTSRLARRIPGLDGQQIRWMLLDTAPRLLPDLDEHLSKTADRVLRRRGIEVRTGQSVARALEDSVHRFSSPRSCWPTSFRTTMVRRRGARALLGVEPSVVRFIGHRGSKPACYE